MTDVTRLETFLAVRVATGPLASYETEDRA